MVKSIITAFHGSSVRCKETEIEICVWVTEGSLRWLMEQHPPAWQDLCKRPRGNTKGNKHGALPSIPQCCRAALSTLAVPFHADRGRLMHGAALFVCSLLGSGVLCTFAAAPDSEVGLYATTADPGVCVSDPCHLEIMFKWGTFATPWFSFYLRN